MPDWEREYRRRYEWIEGLPAEIRDKIKHLVLRDPMLHKTITMIAANTDTPREHILWGALLALIDERQKRIREAVEEMNTRPGIHWKA